MDEKACYDVVYALLALLSTLMLCIVAQRVAMQAYEIVMNNKYEKAKNRSIEEAQGMGEFIGTLTLGGLLLVLLAGWTTLIMQKLADAPMYLVFPVVLLQVAVISAVSLTIKGDCRRRYIARIGDRYGISSMTEGYLATKYPHSAEGFDPASDKMRNTAIILHMQDGKDYCTNCCKEIPCSDDDKVCGHACMYCGAIWVDRINISGRGKLWMDEEDGENT